MANERGRSSPVCGQTTGDEYLNTLAKQMPVMNRLFAALDANIAPNFLDVMSAISEMVAFYTNCDQKAASEFLIEEKMSQNNCRFCS